MQFLSSIIKIINKNQLLSIFVVIGFLFRIISTTPGYYYPHGDELLYGQAINMIITHSLSFEKQYFGFPPLIPWLMIPVFSLVFIPLTFLKTIIIHWSEIYMFIPVFIVPFILLLLIINKFFHPTKQKLIKTILILFWSGLITGGILGLTLFPILRREMIGINWLTALYWGRYLTAFIGALVIILTYKVSLIYFNKKTVAIISSFFVAINYRLILSSHIGLPDMYNVFFFLLTLLAIGYLIKKPSFNTYLMAFISMATFFMIKYQTHIIFPFLIAHISISLKKTKKSFTKFLKNLFDKKIILAGLAGLLFIIISHYYHFVNWKIVTNINNYEAIKYDFGRKILDLYPISYFFHIGIGPALSILGIIGLLIGFARKKYRFSSLILVSSFPTFLFLYVYYTGGGFYTRNLISTIPIVIIFTSLVISELFELIIKMKLLPKSMVVILLVLSIIYLAKDNISNSIVTARAYSVTAPMIKDQEWLNKNIPNDKIFARYQGDPTPVQDQDTEVKSLTPYYRAFSYQELLAEKFDYASIEMSNLRDQFLWWMRQTPNIEIKFWNKPNDLLSENYYALAFRELLWSHELATFISPWQAPSHNFAIVQIDNPTIFPKTSLVSLKKYTNFDSWYSLSYLNNYKSYLEKTTENKTPELTLKSGLILPGAIRFESENISIKECHGYKITAQLKNSLPLEKDERDGFIRLDFYNKDHQPNILSRPEISFVSGRIYGKSDWQTIEIDAIAPCDASFANIGFQTNGNSSSSFYLKNVEIYETKDSVPDKANHITIDDDTLFLPNNEGIL